MTKEELKQHCERQVKTCEMWAKNRGQEPSGKVYEEHKLVLDLIKTLEQQENKGQIRFLDCNSIDPQKFAEAMENQPLQWEVIQQSEQQPCEDCVSRKAAIDMAKSYNTDGYDSYTPLVVDVEDIEELPPVTPTQRWIPVSERLPKESDDYLVTVSMDIGAKEPVREVCKDFFCILSQQWLYYHEDIVAWQPLPKPYEEKRGNENE